MTEALHYAADILRSGGYTCVLIHAEDKVTFMQKGVSPLLSLLDTGRDYSEYSAADKVVGNGAAYLYVLLKIKELYAAIISKAAYATLQRYGIKVYYGSLVKSIRNRSGDGICPIEQAVAGAADPADALKIIRSKLRDLS